MPENIYIQICFRENRRANRYIIRFMRNGGFYVWYQQTGWWLFKFITIFTKRGFQKLKWNIVPGFNYILQFFQKHDCNYSSIRQVVISNNIITGFTEWIDVYGLTEWINVYSYDDLVKEFRVICERINDG